MVLRWIQVAVRSASGRAAWGGRKPVYRPEGGVQGWQQWIDARGQCGEITLVSVIVGSGSS